MTPRCVLLWVAAECQTRLWAGGSVAVSQLIQQGCSDVSRSAKTLSQSSLCTSVHVWLSSTIQPGSECLSSAAEHCRQVVDLISLKPFDMETITNSVRKTRKVIIVEECMKTGGIGASLSAVINEALFDELDHQACLLLPARTVLLPVTFHCISAVGSACARADHRCSTCFGVRSYCLPISTSFPTHCC